MDLEFPRGNPEVVLLLKQFSWPGLAQIEIMNKIKVVQIIPLAQPRGAERVFAPSTCNRICY